MFGIELNADGFLKYPKIQGLSIERMSSRLSDTKAYMQKLTTDWQAFKEKYLFLSKNTSTRNEFFLSSNVLKFQFHFFFRLWF